MGPPARTIATNMVLKVQVLNLCMGGYLQALGWSMKKENWRKTAEVREANQ